MRRPLFGEYIMPGALAFNSALIGIQNGYNNLNRHAGQIASVGAMEADSPVSLTESLIGLRQSTIEIKASMQVLESVDKALGTLLDIEV